MNYRNLSIETWKQLDSSGNVISGYKSIWLSGKNNQTSFLHIFIDEKRQYHFAIEDIRIRKEDIEDPSVNGLTVTINNYRREDGSIKQFIDLCCCMPGYLEEFTEVVKEISKHILDHKENSAEAVTRVIRNWRTFWANQNKQVLSEEEVIGLICELHVLRQLCNINVANALNSWTGPSGGKNDFNFTAWELEVKATRSSEVIHTINGIDQLKPSNNKSLAFISFSLSVVNTDGSVSLPEVIEEITGTCFLYRPDLIARFNQLLAIAGYNPVHAEEYLKFSVDVHSVSFFLVDDNFPKFTSDNLNGSLNSRISKIRYDIILGGLTGKNLNEINWGDYFY